jgi:hypothetical protein
MAGRPSTYAPEIAEQILERVSNGGTVKGACRALGVVPATFFLWVADDVDGLASKYTRAQRLQVQVMRDETLEIADDGTNDWIQGKNGPVFNGEHVRRSEIRIKQRNYLADAIASNLAAKEADSAGQMVPAAEAIAALERIALAKAEPAQVKDYVLPGFEDE